MTVPEIMKSLGGPIGAFAAAWLGAHLGFRKTRKERGLDRVVRWHEDTIQALARYEEKLKRVHNYSRHVLIVQRARHSPIGEVSGELPRTIKVPERLWQELRDAEDAARAGLRLADTYTDLRTQLECSTALSSVVNVVSDQWFDISPEPEIPWLDVSGKVMRVALLRDVLQTSFKRTLELDGFLASLSPTIARRLLIRRIKKEQSRLSRVAP